MRDRCASLALGTNAPTIESSDEAKQPATKMTRRSMCGSIVKPILALIIGLSMIGVAYWISRHEHVGSALPPGPPVPTPSITAKEEQSRRQRQREEFFTNQGTEVLNSEKARNQEAIERAKSKLATSFARYHQGVPRFAEDLSTWGSRYQFAKAALKDWWSKSNTARTLATEKFARLVVSDESLQTDVRQVLSQFASDLEANRNKMLTELQEKVTSAAVPCAALDRGSIDLVQAFMLEVNPRLASLGEQSALAGVLATGGGFVGTEATGAIISRLLAAMAARVAAGAATKGSTVAAGAVFGGEGGTVLTPGVGTAVGVVAGIVVGFAVDWWMEKQFSEKVINECNQILNQMEESLWNNPSEGLALSLTRAVDVTRECNGASIKKIIVGEVE